MEKGFINVLTKNLVKADWNYKQDDEKRLGKLVKNIKRNGQIETIIIRELDGGKYEVVNGNHRLDAFTVLGTKKVHAFNLGKVTLAQAKRIAIETNETRFDTDHIELAKIMSELVEEVGVDDLAETMPFDEHEITDMVNLLKYDPQQYDDDEDDEDGKHTLRFTVTDEELADWNRFTELVKKYDANIEDPFVLAMRFALVDIQSKLRAPKKK